MKKGTKKTARGSEKLKDEIKERARRQEGTKD